MSVVDRVMRAYAKKHELNPNQAAFVRSEISKFIDGLLTGSRREPAMLPEGTEMVGRRTSELSVPEAVDEARRNVRVATRPA